MYQTERPRFSRVAWGLGLWVFMITLALLSVHVGNPAIIVAIGGGNVVWFTCIMYWVVRTYYLNVKAYHFQHSEMTRYMMYRERILEIISELDLSSAMKNHDHSLLRLPVDRSDGELRIFLWDSTNQIMVVHKEDDHEYDPQSMHDNVFVTNRFFHFDRDSPSVATSIDGYYRHDIPLNDEKVGRIRLLREFWKEQKIPAGARHASAEELHDLLELLRGSVAKS